MAGASPAIVEETSLSTPSSGTAPLTSSSQPTAPNAGWELGASPATVEETSLNTLLSDNVPLATSSPLAAPNVGWVARATPEDAALLASASKASHKAKAK